MPQYLDKNYLIYPYLTKFYSPYPSLPRGHLTPPFNIVVSCCQMTNFENNQNSLGNILGPLKFTSANTFYTSILTQIFAHFSHYDVFDSCLQTLASKVK
jgi:hypothetical protein